MANAFASLGAAPVVFAILVFANLVASRPLPNSPDCALAVPWD
jgi:hypothetical protein